MDNAFKKVIGLAGIKSTQLLRRVPLAAKNIKPLLATGNILNDSRVCIMSLDGTESGSEFSPRLAKYITAAHGQTTTVSTAADSKSKYDAIVCDTRGLKNAADLSYIHRNLNSQIGRLAKNGRLVMIGGDPAHDKSPVAAAIAGGAGGFTRAVAKELAAKGTTANMIQACSTLSAGENDAAMGGILSFLLSPRSAFINGQVFSVSSSAQLAAESTTGAADPTEQTVSNHYNVSGKKVVLTGAARGIGEYTARLFHAEGANLLLVDHPSMTERLKEFAGTLGCSYTVLDVTDPNAANVLQEGINQAFGGGDNKKSTIDVMVHNAGITKDKTFKNMPLASFEAVIDVNLASILRIDEMLLNGGVVDSGAKMVYLSSISGVAGAFGQTNYSASKAAVMGYVASLSAALAEKGISVNAVAPGFIETEMTQAIPFLTRNVARHMNSLLQGGHPVDIAETILFLSSPASAGLTGSTIRVCGGHMIGR